MDNFIGSIVIQTGTTKNGKPCYVADGFGNKGGGAFAINSDIAPDGGLLPNATIVIFNESSTDLKIELKGKNIFTSDEIPINRHSHAHVVIRDKDRSFPTKDEGVGNEARWKLKMHVRDLRTNKPLGRCPEIEIITEHADIIIDC